MKKYYCIAFAAITAIVLLMINHISILYENYKQNVESEIEKNLAIAVDDELLIRKTIFNGHKPQKTHSVVRIRMEDMTPAMRDSISKLPGAKDTINVTKAREAGAIGTSAEIAQQQNQDNFILRGDYVKMNVLDSIFSYRMQMDIPHRFVLVDKDLQTIDSIGDFSFRHVDYARQKQIGLKGLQTLRFEAQIPINDFIKEEILILIANVLLMLLVAGCVAFQLRVIRRKEKVLKFHETEAEGAVHDLKSPISTAISLLGMVRYRHRDEPEAMALVKNETMMKQLLHEIEALGDVMREGKSQIVVHREPTDLEALAGRVKQELDLLFQNKRHEITIINELPIGYLVNVDGNLVERILRNLMENAVKYADEGVNVYVRLRQQGEGVLTEVEDNGWGIAPLDQKKIFKPYYRVSQPSGHHRRGSGIGLANARQLVKAHGGVIKLQSQPGKGSVFSFTLEDLSAEK